MARNGKFTPRLTSFEAWALALGGIVGWGAFVMPGTTFLDTAGPLGTAIAFIIAALIMVIIALNLHFMVNRYPVAGGAYVFANEEFGHTHGYICGWFLILAYLAIIPQNATALALISRDLMGNVLELGPSYNLAGYDTYLTELVLTIVVLVIIARVAMRSTRATGILQAVFAVCIVAGVAIIAIAVWSSPIATPQHLEPAFPPDASPLLGIIGVLAVAPWAFVGFDTVTQIGEDAAFSMKRAGGIMILAIVMGAIIYITLSVTAISVLPAGYTYWVDYIKDLPNLDGLKSMPVFNAVHMTMGQRGLIVLDIATMGAIMASVTGFTLAVSRLAFAMARGGALPSWFGKVHPEYNTPTNALRAVLGLSIALALLGRSVLGWIIDMSSIGATIAFLYASLATAKQAKIEGKGLWRTTGVFGAVIAAVFIVLLLVPLPMFNSVLDMGSYVLLLAWIVLGINFFTPDYQSNTTALPDMPTDFDE
ncbi:MAG: APC family permease [Coriobacteriia bacterium]|nr:APC family permease [Coriobacteriia bacterium]